VFAKLQHQLTINMRATGTLVKSHHKLRPVRPHGKSLRAWITRLGISLPAPARLVLGFCALCTPITLGRPGFTCPPSKKRPPRLARPDVGGLEQFLIGWIISRRIVDRNSILKGWSRSAGQVARITDVAPVSEAIPRI
jgi:hypothetical protein